MMDGANNRRPGRPRKAQGAEKVKYKSLSTEDRERIIDTFRRGGDLKQLAATLGINIKTEDSFTGKWWTKFTGYCSMNFLVRPRRKFKRNEQNSHVVFIFDYAPAHHRAGNATLASVTHTLKKLPPYSPFFNAIEEVFSKFKSHVKAFLSERREELLTTPPGMTKKQHRRTMLMEVAASSMQQVRLRVI
ncbi:hypothetical protein MTO96_046929 [Rhipicephalus appendiculatus]